MPFLLQALNEHGIHRRGNNHNDQSSLKNAMRGFLLSSVYVFWCWPRNEHFSFVLQNYYHFQFLNPKKWQKDSIKRKLDSILKTIFAHDNFLNPDEKSDIFRRIVQ